jgi:hypothetical protein
VLVGERTLRGGTVRGVLVWGVQWPDGRCSYRWNSPLATSTAADSIDDVQEIHGDGGATRLVWLDSPDGARTWRLAEGNLDAVLDMLDERGVTVSTLDTPGETELYLKEERPRGGAAGQP